MRSALISLLGCLLALGCASPSQPGKPSPCGAPLPSSAPCSKGCSCRQHSHPQRPIPQLQPVFPPNATV